MRLSTYAIAIVILLSGVAHASERASLEMFYDALNGEQWKQSEGWLTDAPLDDWHGITTRDGKIVSIELADNGLSGQLSYDFLPDLTWLEVLDLRWNEIEGFLPDSLGHLVRLESLLLTDNEFVGFIPQTIGRLTSLKRLDLSHNQLTGEIPSVLGQLKSLEALGLHHNQLTGSVPLELGRIPALRRLIAHANHLEVDDVSAFEQVQTLSHLKLTNTRLDEESPTEVEGISGLDVLEETTLVLEDQHAYEYIAKVMATIQVRDNAVHLTAPTSMSAEEVENLNNLIDGINEYIHNSGDSVDSASDLERILVLHSDETLSVPDDAQPHTESSLDFEFGVQSDGLGQRWTRGNGETIARVTCYGNRTGAHYPHTSKHETGYIHGKAYAWCQYVFGPPQQITIDAFVWLQQRKRFLVIFKYWKRVGIPAVKQKSDPLSIIFKQNELIAKRACVDGTYRTEFLLFVNGSVLGPFTPWPNRMYSATRYVPCSSQ